MNSHYYIKTFFGINSIKTIVRTSDRVYFSVGDFVSWWSPARKVNVVHKIKSIEISNYSGGPGLEHSFYFYDTNDNKLKFTDVVFPTLVHRKPELSNYF